MVTTYKYMLIQWCNVFKFDEVDFDVFIVCKKKVEYMSLDRNFEPNKKIIVFEYV